MDVAKKTAEIMSLVLSRPISENDDVSMAADAEWTSLKHIEIIVTLEEEFDVSFKPADIPLLTSREKLTEKITTLLGG